MEEAQNLNTRQQIGGGSKWRTSLVLYGTLALLLVGAYLRMQREIPAAYRPYFIVGVIVLWILLIVWQRRARGRSRVTNKLEISAGGLTLQTAGAHVTSPWSAFSQCLESSNLFVLVDRPKGMIVVVPKRAFPDEDGQRWFRTQAARMHAPADTAAVATPVDTQRAAADKITLKFRLGFRDYLDRSLASWLTWGIVLLIGALIIGTAIYSVAHPPPHAVYTSGQMFWMFELPFLLVMTAMIILLIAIRSWFAHRRYLISQEWSFSDDSITFSGRDGSGTLPWTTYTRYKETRWSFILWNPVGWAWMMFPKRAFASPADLQLCHSLIAHHLRRSPWFFG